MGRDHLPGVLVDADTLAMCQIMCEEARGVAACHVLGKLAGHNCPVQNPERPRKRRKVVYSDRFVSEVRTLTGNLRFPLSVVTPSDEGQS